MSAIGLTAVKLGKRNPVVTGLVLLLVAGIAALGLFEKSAIMTRLSPGETIKLELARDYKIRPYASLVKIAGTKVGVVQSVDHDPPGPVVMTLKVDTGTRALLGTEPRAEIRPVTVLGGTYFVQLYPGVGSGESGSNVIPAQRVALPVELDRLLAAIPGNAQLGLQAAVGSLDDTFKAGVGAPLNKVLEDAPATLGPAGIVGDALRGLNKDTDLARTVSDVNKTAQILSATPGQLASTVDSLATTAGVLGKEAAAVDQTITALPETMRQTRIGSDKLSTMFDKLIDTAGSARPAARKLAPLLHDLSPALADLKPVLDDLNPLLEDTTPLLKELTPTVTKTTEVLDDLHGPVLNRVNGPVLDTFNSEFRGLPPKYPGAGSGAKLYEELAYFITNFNGALMHYNGAGHQLVLAIGAGPQSVYGTGVTAQTLQDYLAEMYGDPGHSSPKPVGPVLPPTGIPLPDPGPLPTIGVPTSPLKRPGGGR